MTGEEINPRIDSPRYPWPCKDCAERHPGCHAECERYAKAKKKHAEIKARDRAENGEGFSFLRDKRIVKRENATIKFKQNRR